MRTTRLLTRSILAVLMICWMATSAVQAQVSLKNNLLYDGSLTPNIGVEVGLSQHWTFDGTVGLNPWKFSGNKQWRHWLVQPEWRRYFCQPMNGAFVGFHLMGGEFNVGGVKLPFGISPTLRHHRYEGWYAGAGLVYGYQWPVSRHFSLEAVLGLGYDYLKYDQYPCEHCGAKEGSGHHHYVGPTKIALNVVYNFNRGAAQSGGASATDGLGVTIYADGAGQGAALATSAGRGSTMLAQAEGEEATLLGGRATITNTALASVGQNLVLSMAVGLDSLRLEWSQTVVIRPVLRSADGGREVRFRPLLVNSHNQHILHQRGLHNRNYPDAIELERRNGTDQRVQYLSQVPLQDWTDRDYTLWLEEDLCGCGDQLADNETALLAWQKPEPVLSPAIEVPLETSDYRKEKQLEGRAYVDFRVNKTDLDPNYRRNPEELKKILATIDDIKNQTDAEINSITIHGYASPEGSFQSNARLAEGRAATLAAYIHRLYKLPDGVINSTSTPEDWAGLRAWVADPSASLADTEREALLAIIDGPLDLDPKDLAIRRQYPRLYQRLLNEVYPSLRHSDYVITYTIRPYSLEESRRVYGTHPEDLSLSELQALAADAGLDTQEGYAITLRSAELLPDNPRAQLQAAQAALKRGDYDTTERLLKRVADDDPQRCYLLGSVRKMQHRYDEAQTLMQKALAGGIAEAKTQLEEIGTLR